VLARPAGSSRGRRVAASGLDWGAWHRSVRAEHATIAPFRLKSFATSLAVIEILASIGWHLLSRLMPTLRTGDCGCFDHEDTVLEADRIAFVIVSKIINASAVPSASPFSKSRSVIPIVFVT
jgi:hypothetical protein